MTWLDTFRWRLAQELLRWSVRVAPHGKEKVAYSWRVTKLAQEMVEIFLEGA